MTNNAPNRIQPWALRVGAILARAVRRLAQWCWDAARRLIRTDDGNRTSDADLKVGATKAQRLVPTEDKNPESGAGSEVGAIHESPLLSIPSPGWGRSAKARLIAAGTLVLIGFIALREHDAHVRQATELKRLKKQTATDVAALRDQAARALRQASAQAEQVQGLESRRRALEQKAAELGQQLASLRAQESREAGQVATLPTSEVAMRVATRLGIEVGAVREPPLPAPALRSRASSGGAEPRNPPAGRSAPSPELSSVGDPSAGAGPSESRGVLISGDALRKIDAAFVELDACRGERTVRDQQAANCREQVENDAAIIRRQAASIDELHQAVAAKDQILARREAEFQTELKAARGSRIGRIGRTLKYVAIGVAIGVVIR